MAKIKTTEIFEEGTKYNRRPFHWLNWGDYLLNCTYIELNMKQICHKDQRGTHGGISNKETEEGLRSIEAEYTERDPYVELTNPKKDEKEEYTKVEILPTWEERVTKERDLIMIDAKTKTLNDELKNNLAGEKDDIGAMYKLVKQCSGIDFSGDKSEFGINIKILYKNIIRLFKDKYRGYIFDKIRKKQSYSESEKLMINSLTLVITAIGQYPSLYFFHCSDGVDIIIDCLSHLHDAPRPNDVATRIVHICLYSLCDIIDYRIIPLFVTHNTSQILLGCFNNYDDNEHIKLSSAIAILRLNHDDRDCYEYLLKITNNVKTDSNGEYFGFPIKKIRETMERYKGNPV